MMVQDNGKPVTRPEPDAPAGVAASNSRRAQLSEWIDRRAGTLFIMPAVVMILIFPLVASLVMSVSRIRLRAGGYKVSFVGTKNFEKQFFGSEQFHFLGTFGEVSLLGWGVMVASALVLVWWLYKYVRRQFWWLGFIGRLITANLVFGIIVLASVTLLSGNNFGTLGTTLFYVFVGCGIQFVIGLGLALLCSQQIRGRNFFRVVFFIPLMITPIGIGYAFRMLADTTKGPFSIVWQWVGLGDFAWSTSAWAARSFIVIGDSWQWIPFIFVILLAACENIPRDFVEAAEVDGASQRQI